MNNLAHVIMMADTQPQSACPAGEGTDFLPTRQIHAN
jgi:hypothetical protein